jgi:hypothetical protein
VISELFTEKKEDDERSKLTHEKEKKGKWPESKMIIIQEKLLLFS